MMIDYLIVGQGLAGSCLAWQLVQRGKRVIVIDKPEKTVVR
ncbi:MAG: FAD-binding protein [Cyclobacteriaceae bacterium]|nr:MAG: FAD-binding protein [Cyclobacteriaceae bacterium]